MIENRKIMAQNITNQMILKNVTAAEVCKALNIKQNTFSDWVNGKTYPRIDSIEAMANYFGIPKFMLVEDVKVLKIHTEVEEQFLDAYRNASDDIKQAVRAVLKLEECDK